LISSEVSGTTIRIVNAIGSTVYEETLNDEENEISKGIPTENFPPGNYFAVIQHGAHSYKQAFVMQ
jgi:hypothetical protein